MKAALVEHLSSGEYRDFRFAVAYARHSGIQMLDNALRRFREGGGTIQGIVGINQGNTSYQAVESLHELTKNHRGLFLRCGKGIQRIFHPKIYIFGKTVDEFTPDKVIIGSSNFTGGGLGTNEECNVLLSADDSNREFYSATKHFWNRLRENNAEFTTIAAAKDLIGRLQNCGALIDETAHLRKGAAKNDIVVANRRVLKILDAVLMPQYMYFAMTLSRFDVSEKSGDPVILIPIKARDQDENFWFWPHLFVEERIHRDMYLEAIVEVDDRPTVETIRLYYYPAKHEFRLKSELIKRNGVEGDILMATRVGRAMRLSLIRQHTAKHRNLAAKLSTRVSNKKKFGYFNAASN